MVIMMIKMQEESRTSIMDLMKTIMTAQATAAPKTSGLGEIVEVMKSLKTMTPAERPLDNFKETLGMMKLVKEVTGDGDSDSKGGLMSDIKEFLEVYPLIKDKLADLRPLAQMPPPALAPQAAQTNGGPLGPGGTIVPGGTPQMPVMDPLSQKIVDIVPRFVEAGKAAAPVTEWGAFLLETFDTEIMPLLLPVLKKKYKVLVKDEDDVYDIVLRLAKDPEEKETVFKQIPPLSPYRDWCIRVIDEAVRLAESPEVEEDIGSTGGSSILEAVAANGKDAHA